MSRVSMRASRLDRDLSLRCTNVNPLLARPLALLLVATFTLPAFADNPATVSIDLTAKPWAGDLDSMIQRRVIRVLVPYSKTFYFVDLGGTQRGLSYEVMRGFEDSLNAKRKKSALKVNVVFIATNRDQLIPQLLAGKGDVIAANLTVTPQRSARVDFARPIASGVQEIVVTGPGAPKLSTLDSLSGQEVYVQRSSSYYDSLMALNEDFRHRRLAPVRLRLAPEHFEAEDVLEMVNAGLVKITVVDRYLANFWREIYDHLEMHDALVVRERADIAFAMRKYSPLLKKELDAFMRTHARGTEFGNVVLKEYLKDTRWAKNATSDAEMKKFRDLVALFRKYGTRYKIDPLLVAAQGYQESRLDHTTRSSVGAIGVMQVMPATGKEMDVGNIAQLEPNIHAGIKYVRFVIDQYYANEPMTRLNKVFFAFASYNAGPARIRGLRDEAKRRGLDQNVWFNNVEHVAAEKIGNEPVQYVSNIYKYFIAYSLAAEQRREQERLKSAPVVAATRTAAAR